MEEQKRVVCQVLERYSYNVPSAREPCVSVSDAPFGLEPPRP